MKKEYIFATGIALLMAYGYIYGFPMNAFMNLDVLSFLNNLFIIYAIGFVLSKLLCPQYTFYKKIHKEDIHTYWGIMLCLFLVPFFSLYLGLHPLKANPNISEVLISGVLYYTAVGLIEEFFCRGLFLQTFLICSNNELLSVLLSAILYGLGHLPNMIGQPWLVVIMRFLWTMSLGLFLGYIYIKTKRNLTLVTIMHIVTDLSGILFLYSERNWYSAQSAACIFLFYLILGLYGIWKVCEEDFSSFV